MITDSVAPSTRPLQRGELMLLPVEVDRIYRQAKGTAIRDAKAGRLPGRRRKPRRGLVTFLIHPDDAFAMYGGDR